MKIFSIVICWIVTPTLGTIVGYDTAQHWWGAVFGFTFAISMGLLSTKIGFWDFVNNPKGEG